MGTHGYTDMENHPYLKNVHLRGILLKILAITWLPATFLIVSSCNTRSQTDRHVVQDTISKPTNFRRINVRSFKAMGDGKHDDTKSIQAAINAAKKGDTVFIPAGIYKVKTLVLKSDLNLVGKGLLKQFLEQDTQRFSRVVQNSSAPLFFGRNIHHVHLTFYASTRNEGLYISKSSNIKITFTRLQGNPEKLHAFPGMLFYECDTVEISNSVVAHYGSPRQSARIYQAGTGIRFLSSKHIRIEQNKILHNGENGIFMHSSGEVRIHHNHIAHNGMSAIQIGFGKANVERNFVLTKNMLEHNAADAIDINNKIGSTPLAIACTIQQNKSFNNGFVANESTVDGSGLATLINVSDVKIIDNHSQKSNRPALYLEKCGEIFAEGNTADNKVEIVHSFDRIRLTRNTFDALSILAKTSGKELYLDHNTLRTLLFPNDIRIDSIALTNNKLLNASLNFNLEGNLLMEGNDIHTDGSQSTLLLVKLNSAHINDNQIVCTGNYAIMIGKNAQQVVLEQNDIRSINACVYDEGAKDLTLLSNKMTSLPGGSLNRTLISRNPNGLKIKGNIHYAGKRDNSIRFEGNGIAYVADEKTVSGFVDYGKVIVKKF